MDEEHSLQNNIIEDLSDPATFSYGQWSWLPDWHLPPSGPPANYGNPGWGPSLPGFLQLGYPQGSPSQHQSPLGELQRVMEEVVQHAVQAMLLSTRDPQVRPRKLHRLAPEPRQRPSL